MRDKVIILFFTYLLVACNSQTNKKSAIVESADNTGVTLSNRILERFFPEKKAVVEFDTTIADRQIQITIKRTDLDTYVINEYEYEGKKQIDKYRDAEIALTIKQKSQLLLDTVFRKSHFSKYAENGFMDIAIFNNYWFKKIGKDSIEFLGTISKPETDWALDFKHYFDLTNKTLKFIEQKDEKEVIDN
jgi:hypothetical protein